MKFFFFNAERIFDFGRDDNEIIHIKNSFKQDIQLIDISHFIDFF